MNETSFLDLAKQAGADAVLKKPFELDELVNTVNEALRKHASGSAG